MKSIKLKKGSEYYYPYPYFPIGYIYLSTSNVNPSTYFGGTWERIQGKFLLCANDNVTAYNAGKTGGAESVTLATTQIPAHNHGLNSHTHTYARSNDNTNGHALSAGQMPVHSHELQDRMIIWDAAGNNRTDIVQNGNHNNNCVVFSSWGKRTHDSGSGESHSHRIGRTSVNSGAASGNTANAGGSKAHTNMPPFLAVYAWKRTK